MLLFCASIVILVLPLLARCEDFIVPKGYIDLEPFNFEDGEDNPFDNENTDERESSELDLDNPNLDMQGNRQLVDWVDGLGAVGDIIILW